MEALLSIEARPQQDQVERELDSVSRPGSVQNSGHSLRVVHVAHSDWYMWNFKRTLLEGLRSAGYEVSVACPEGEYARSLRHIGFVVHPLSIDPHGASPFEALQVLVELTRLYREIRPWAVHHFNAKGIVLGSIAARFAGIERVINAVTGGVSANPRKRLTELDSLTELGVRMAFHGVLPGTEVVFQNGHDLQAFVRRKFTTEDRAHLIRGSGADTSVFKPERSPDRGRPKVLFAARLIRTKGFVEYGRAAARLLEAGVNAEFLAAGSREKDHRSALPDSLFDKLVTHGPVEWIGFVDDMPALLNDVDVVCLPTYYPEGIPKILIEAASTGRPLVATETAGCSEIVRPEENGLLVEPRNVKQLTEALRTLIDSPELRVEWGRMSRTLVLEEFSAERVLEQTLEVYRKMETSP